MKVDCADVLFRGRRREVAEGGARGFVVPRLGGDSLLRKSRAQHCHGNVLGISDDRKVSTREEAVRSWSKVLAFPGRVVEDGLCFVAVAAVADTPT